MISWPAAALKQHRRGRVPDALVVVVDRHPRHGGAAVADPIDDRCRDLPEFRGDQRQSLIVRFGRCDLQHRYTSPVVGSLSPTKLWWLSSLSSSMRIPSPGVSDLLHGDA